jgi:hypothetical protein
MRWTCVPLALLLFAGFGLAAPLQDPPQEPVPAQQDVQDAIEVLYASQIERDLQLSNEQLPRIAPILKRWIRMRLQAPALRNQAMREWNQAIQRGAPPEEIRRLKEAYDNTDAGRLRQQFLEEVDRHLTPQQQQRLRRAVPQADRRIQDLLNQNRQQIEDRRRAQQELRQQQQQRPARGDTRPPARPPAKTR